MSSIKIVIRKGKKAVSLVEHYTYAMSMIQGKAEHKNLDEQLNWLMEQRKDWKFEPEPVDAGLIVFDMNKKTIFNEQNDGFDFANLEKFPSGWKMQETAELGIITASNFAQKKKEREAFFAGMRKH